MRDEKLQLFYSVIFELKLYKFIKDNGLYIIANDDNKGGPDFDCDIGYVECVTATKGQKGTSTRSFVDKILGEEYGYGIPQFSMGDGLKYKAIIPRISSVIRDKKKRYEDYLNEKMIDVNKPRIIAVDASKFYQLDREDFEHAFVKVLYAAGKRCDFMDFNNQSNNRINSFCQYDERLIKKFSQTEEEIEKNKDVLGYFYKDEYKDISAVILVWDSILNKINNKHFEIFLNPNAVCPVDVSQLINKFDYWLALISSDNSEIRLECHRVNKF